MRKIKLRMIFLAAIAFFAVLAVRTQSNRQSESKEVKQKVASVQSKDDTNPASAPGRSVPKEPHQGYEMATDVLDAFGGESESDNYRISSSSGGQPSAIGTSESNSFTVGAGFIHASFVRRGDATADGEVDIADVMHLINYLFISGSPPQPMEAGDCNRDGVVDVADVMYLINYLFIGGSPPCEP